MTFIKIYFVKFILIMFALLPSGICCVAQDGAKKQHALQASIMVDGSNEMQRIYGIGVNANTSSWNGEDLKPAIDFLIDSMGAKIWRVITESVEKWEDVNDNGDPFDFDTAYYHALYETPKFQKVWKTIAYLNSKGITDQLVLNFMGAVPKWMGGERILPQFEDEYIEMVSSFFVYAVKEKHLKFGLISPMNETDITKEGPTVGSVQYVNLLDKLIARLHSLGLNDVRYIAPDVARMNAGVEDYVPLLMQDTVIMHHLAHIGLHSYQGYAADVDSLLRNSAYPKTDYWMTEWNNWCQGCDDGEPGNFNFDFGIRSVGFLFDFLEQNATAAIIWEAYDSKYEHDAPSPMSFWGLLAYDTVLKRYSPRKYYYVVNEVASCLEPGSTRIRVDGTGPGLRVLAFKDRSMGGVSLVGLNVSDRQVAVKVNVAGALTFGRPVMYYTTAEINHKRARVGLSGKKRKGKAGSFISVIVPAHSVFSLADENK